MKSLILTLVTFQLLWENQYAFQLVSPIGPSLCKWNKRECTERMYGMDDTGRSDDDEKNISTNKLNPKDAKGIIFDIDGTLANSWKLGFDATQVVLKNNGIELITEELYHECTRYCTPDRLARHAGLVPENEEEFHRIGEKLANEFDELYVGLVSLETAGFYDGIQDLILRLPKDENLERRNVKVAALTNACVAYAHAVLKTNCPNLSESIRENKSNGGVYERFTSIHGADTVPKPKPSPSGLLLCCDEIGLHPSDCVYVGDSPSDAIAAREAGMIAIGVLWGSHSLESLQSAEFDYLCKTVEQLESLLLEPDC